jgi:hypothetical protein
VSEKACFGEESLDEACDRGGPLCLLFSLLRIRGEIRCSFRRQRIVDGDVILSLLGPPPLVPYYDGF